MKVVFLTGSYIDLHHHLALADNLRRHCEITFLVKPVSFRKLLWERGYSSLLYSELVTGDIRRIVKNWWRDQRTKDFSEIFYKDYSLWECTEFERKLVLRDTSEKGDVLQRGLFLDSAGVRSLENIYKYTAGLIEGFEQLLDFLNPHGVFVFNGLFLPTRPCAEVTKRAGIKRYFSEEAYFPKTMLIDDEGVNAASFLCGPKWNQIAQKELSSGEIRELEGFLEKFHSSGLSRVESSDRLNRDTLYSQTGIPVDKKIVLFPAQVETDTNTILFSPNYKDNKDVIRELARVVSNYPQYHLVVKVHPRDEAKVKEFKEILNGCGTVVSKINIHSLIEICEIVAVINTTVGLEALTYNKPVIVLGKAIYSNKNFTFDVSNRTELDNIFKQVAQKPFLSKDMQIHCRKFLAYLVNEYLYFIEDNEFARNKNRVIEQRIFSEIESGKPAFAVNQFDKGYFSKILDKQEKKKSFYAQRKSAACEKWQRITGDKSIMKILLIQASEANTYDRTFNRLKTLFPQAGIDMLLFPEIGDDKILRYKSLQGVQVFSNRKKAELLKMFLKEHDLLILSTDAFYAASNKPMIFSSLCRSRYKFVIDRYLGKNYLN